MVNPDNSPESVAALAILIHSRPVTRPFGPEGAYYQAEGWHLHVIETPPHIGGRFHSFAEAPSKK